MIKHILESIKQKEDVFHEIQRTLVSVMQFTLITMIDSMVISKYFILANKDYDKRFLRGKMKIILNEGFKKLYGFDEKTHKKSEWKRLSAILKYFPEKIQRQYQELSFLLEKHSNTSSWWKDVRDVETHMVAEELYESRCKEIIESEVILDSLKLFDTFFAADCFLTNMHAYINNYLLDKYLRGELKDEE